MALTGTAYLPKWYKISGINLASTGNTTIYPATSGKNAVVYAAYLMGATFAGGDATEPFGSIGSESTTFANVAVDQEILSRDVDTRWDFEMAGIGALARVSLTTNGLKFRCSAASTYSPHTVDLYVLMHIE